MFEDLKKWPRILVTGPQRSGTRIGATIIAKDTGHWFVGEEEIGVDSLNRLWKLLKISRNVVIQCPALFVYSNLLGMSDKGLLVVCMRRDLEDIKASRERIGWGWIEPERIRRLTLDGDPAEISYNLWDAFMATDLQEQAFDVPYQLLRDHPLWVPKEDRKHFAPRQTR